MKYKPLPVGKERFSDIRESGDYYVDKTGFLSVLLHMSFEVFLITRPRRFGKTLTMSMLEDFLDITRQSGERFAGLRISEDAKLCAEWMNQWPVVFISLKGVEGLDFEGAYGMLEVLIANTCKKYAFLEKSDSVDAQDQQLFQELKAQRADSRNLKNCLILLTRMMHAHFGKPCILLVDEYDVPLAKAHENGYYREMLDVLRAMFAAFKTNEYLKFAVVTGCLKIAKESIFTGTNNFVTDTISSRRFDAYIGFTEKEVMQLLSDEGFPEHAGEVREWYDGYRFGEASVYCPWDVLNHVQTLRADPVAPPESYWANTSGNSVLHKFLKAANRTAKAEVERLIEGGAVVKQVNEQITYGDMERSIDNLWSALYLTGYVTARERRENGALELAIPNRELRSIFVTQVEAWFTEDAVQKQGGQVQALAAALRAGDAENAEAALNGLLKRGISIRNTAVRKPKKENFYHEILMGLLMSVDDWSVHSNREDGDGYSDIHVEMDDADIAFVMEVKYAESGDLEAGCREAMEQMDVMRYPEGLKALGYETIYAYGVACYKKQCRITCRKCE